MTTNPYPWIGKIRTKRKYAEVVGREKVRRTDPCGNCGYDPISRDAKRCPACLRRRSA